MNTAVISTQPDAIWRVEQRMARSVVCMAEVFAMCGDGLAV